MPKVRVNAYSVSLDGYGAGPDQSLENPLGVGGIYVALGPTVGAVITILLAEFLRIFFGTKAVGWDNLVYGVLLVLFIIFLPKGILGSIIDRFKAQRTKPVEKPVAKPVAS